MKKIFYYVIGGQYSYTFYGGTTNYSDAVRLSNRSMEYWDNWQGWHVPAIYRAEDTIVNENCIRIPKYNACPVRPILSVSEI